MAGGECRLTLSKIYHFYCHYCIVVTLAIDLIVGVLLIKVQAKNLVAFYVFLILDRYRNEIDSKDVGDLLAAMELTEDDKITKDPEAWQNWIRSLEKVLSEESH